MDMVFCPLTSFDSMDSMRSMLESIGIEFCIARLPRQTKGARVLLELSLQNEIGAGLVVKIGLFHFGASLHLNLVGLGVHRLEHRLHNFLLPPLRYDNGKVLVNLLVGLGELDALGVVLVKVANVEGVRGVHFAARRHQRRRILEQIDLFPVDVPEVDVFLELLGAAAPAAQPFVDVARQQRLEQRPNLVAHGVGQLDRHGHGHFVYFVFVLGLVLSEGAVALEQLEYHAAEREPVGAGVVGDAFGEHLGRHVAVGADGRVRLFFREVARQTQVRYAHVTMLVEQYVGRLEIAVDDGTRVHVLQTEYDLGSVEFDLFFGEYAVLRQVIVKVAAVHQVKDERELVDRVERVRHADYEWRAVAVRHRRQHDALVQRQTFALFHFDALFVQAFHGVHFARVRLATPVHLAEAAPAYYPVHAKVVHAQLDV
ncbi:hypothetical protein BpHYR1_005796 [Brachionus plicatilis]|uniref:Uncharacterized protein n=1 Tax=Brachionus plicatilis TaxID=10195 RepID=A0A3M7QE99_BRAPC|nr:hypothetical protein BpHYR1_005796 [Brachionus plicatilis]